MMPREKRGVKSIRSVCYLMLFEPAILLTSCKKLWHTLEWIHYIQFKLQIRETFKEMKE